MRTSDSFPAPSFAPRTFHAVLLAAVALCVAATADAQTGGMGGGMRGGGMGRGGNESRAPATEPAPAAASLQDQLYDARMRLLVTKEQSAAWERFYRDLLAFRAVAAWRGPGELASARQAIQLQVEYARQRAALTEDLAASFAALQAQLDDRQQETADQVLPPLLLQATEAPVRPARAGTAR
jgi:hypothetical protein